MKNLITGIVAILALTGTIYLYAMSVLVAASISARGPQYLGEMHFFKTYDVDVTFDNFLKQSTLKYSTIGGASPSEVKEMMTAKMSSLIQKKFGAYAPIQQQSSDGAFKKNPSHLSLQLHVYSDNYAREYVYIQAITTRTKLVRAYWDYRGRQKASCNPIVFFLFPDQVRDFGQVHGNLACGNHANKTAYESMNVSDHAKMLVTWESGDYFQRSPQILKSNAAAKDAIEKYLKEIVSQMSPQIEQAEAVESYFLQKTAE